MRPQTGEIVRAITRRSKSNNIYKTTLQNAQNHQVTYAMSQYGTKFSLVETVMLLCTTMISQ
jgi:hypothetical protein